MANEALDLAEVLAQDVTPVRVEEAPAWDPDMVVILSGCGGERLAEEIAGLMGLPATSCSRAQRPGGESQVQLERGHVVHLTAPMRQVAQHGKLRVVRRRVLSEAGAL